MPNTPFTQNVLPEESKRLMVSADEVMLRERNVKLHQYSNLQQGTHNAPTHHTKRELFSKPVQDYHLSSYRALNSTAYTSASRSYKSYDADGRSHEHKSHDYKSHDANSGSHDHRSNSGSHDHRSHDYKSHGASNFGSIDKPGSYDRGSVEGVQHKEHKTEFATSSRSRSDNVGSSLVKTHNTQSAEVSMGYLERNATSVSDGYFNCYRIRTNYVLS